MADEQKSTKSKAEQDKAKFKELSVQFMDDMDDIIKGKDPDDLEHVIEGIERIVKFKRDTQEYATETIIKDVIDYKLKAFFASSNIPDGRLKFALEQVSNNSKSSRKAVDEAWNSYTAIINLEEDRVKLAPGDVEYKDKPVITKPNILSSCNTAMNYINEHKNNNTNNKDALKHEIETLHFLENANEARPWYSKFWSFIKSIFTGNSETIAINNLRNHIIDSSPFERAMTDKAVNAKYEKHLDKILSVAQKRLDNGPLIKENDEIDKVEQLDIPNEALLNEYDIIKEESEEVKLQNSKEKQEKEDLQKSEDKEKDNEEIIGDNFI